MPQHNTPILILARLDRTAGESLHALNERSDMTPPHWKHLVLLGAIATPPLAARAETPDADIAALRDQLQRQQQVINQQQQRLNTLEQSDGERWLNERRAEEVKTLVREVLADADTRASLLQDGLTAGYDRGFFIKSNDGAFTLKINGEEQTRFIYNTQDADEGSSTDDDEVGFQIRRARLAFSGNVISPDLTYRLRLAYDRGSGNVSFDDAWFAYKLNDDWKIQLGQFKPQFIREESVGGFSQLAVERSYLADYFTIDYTQGAELSYTGSDRFRAFVAVHDGSYAANTEFNADRTETALSGRAEFLLAGDWRQFSDFTSFSGNKLGILVGIGAAYEIGERGRGTANPDVLKYSADVSAEFGGANLFAAFYGQQFDDNDKAGLPTNLDDANQIGFVVQGGVFLIPDKFELFARYEWIDFDGAYYRSSGGGTQGGTGDLAGNDDLSLVTVGGNWYFKKHNAKFTVDLVWALDPVPVGNSGAGILASSEDDQVSLRSQLQFVF